MLVLHVSSPFDYQGLTELLELHLDRTLVDDEGAKVIGQLSKLQVLSMAETK